MNNKNNDLQIISIQLPKTILKDLKVKAVLNDMSLSAYIRNLIIKDLDKTR